MNAPQTLFDSLHPSDVRAVAARPRVRTTDGVTARAAAKKTESGNGPLMQALRHEAALWKRPFSAFQAAYWVQVAHRGANGKPRWKADSVRSAVSRAPFLLHVDNDGRVPDTGNACRRYVLKEGA